MTNKHNFDKYKIWTCIIIIDQTYLFYDKKHHIYFSGTFFHYNVLFCAENEYLSKVIGYTTRVLMNVVCVGKM